MNIKRLRVRLRSIKHFLRFVVLIPLIVAGIPFGLIYIIEGSLGYLGYAVYAFSVMLAIYLLGLSFRDIVKSMMEEDK